MVGQTILDIIHIVSERYDFSYWPPRPLPQEFITPAENSFSDEVCRDVLYVPHDARRRAVYATGDWVDIQDFWLQAKEPRPESMRTHSGVITETDPLTGATKEYRRVGSRYHLSAASYAFHGLGYELARTDADLNAEPGDERHLFEVVTEAQSFLHYEAFNSWNKTVDHAHILMARQAILDIYERRDPLPIGAGLESEVIYAKVALGWHEGIENIGARDWT